MTLSPVQPMALVRSTCIPVLVLVLVSIANGQDKAEQSSAAAIEQYRSAVAMQNKQLYDLAIKEWKTFIKDFGDDPLAANSVHYLGVCYFQQKDFANAERTFNQALESFPKTKLTPESLLNLGLAQFNLGQAGEKDAMQQSIKTLQRLIGRHGKTPSADKAYFYLAEALYAESRLQEAAEVYPQAIRREKKNKTRRAEALLGYGVALQQLDQPKEALRVFDELLQLRPPQRLALEARVRRADALLATGKARQAEAEFNALRSDMQSGRKANEFGDYVLLRSAASKLARKDYAAAAETYAALVSKFPKSSYVDEARVAAAKCHSLAGNAQSGRRFAEQALERNDEKSTEAAHWLARIEIAEGNYRRALEVANEALKSATDEGLRVDLLLDQADAFYELPEQRAKASATYGEIAEKFPKHEQAPHARYMAAYAALDARDYSDVAKHAEAFLDKYASHELLPEVLAISAESLLQKGKHEAAGEVFAKLTERFPNADDATVWRVRAALCANVADKHRQVIRLLGGRANEIDDNVLRGEAHFLLAAAYFERRDVRRAAREAQLALEASPQGAQSDRALLLLARAQRKTGNTQQADDTLRRLAREFPASPLLDTAKLERAEMLAASGNRDQAAEAYEALIDTAADSQVAIEAVYGWGWTLIQSEQYETAQRVFSKLIEMDADHDRTADCYYARAVTRQKSNQFQGALRDLDRYFELARRDAKPAAVADAYYLRGLCLVQREEFSEGAASFRKALKADSDYQETDRVLYELAWAEQSLRDQEEAARTFRQLAKRFPESPLAAEALYRAAEYDFANQRYAAARNQYADAANHSGANNSLKEQCYHKLGWCQFRRQKYSEAEAAFERQLSLFPTTSLSSDGRLMLAECAFQRDDFAAALPAYEVGLGSGSNNQALVSLALLHAGQAAAQLKKWSTSEKWLTQLINKYPESDHAITAQYETAWAQQNLGKTKAAEKLFQQVAESSDGLIGAKARFMLGELQFLREDFDAAIKTFFQVAYGFGHPDSPASFREWQANALFEAARCCESTKRFDAAKKLYAELIEGHPQSDKVVAARQKLEGLAK